MAVHFVGGIHGVGKTTFCQTVADALGLTYVSASQLIRVQTQSSSQLDKRVTDVDQNQSALVEALAQFGPGVGTLLMDGHYCLLTETENPIVKVPIAVFARLGIERLFVITDDPRRIVDRLAGRDSVEYSVGFVTEFQEAELSHARTVAAALGITAREISATSLADPAGLKDALKLFRAEA